MDKNASIERRFSLNSSGMPQPIAESTCLNGTGLNNHFQWGGKSISPLSRSNSSLGLSNNATENRNKRTHVTMRSPVRARANMTKIEPRMYADVQSKGLTSRIIKYHENGVRLNRSMSMSSLHTRPGLFPVVNLKKTELPYRAIKQNISMTRIPPPGKSMYCGNTLSGLLRSNSVVGLQKSDEEISRENRPILHPPPTESDLTPTRSVLDVLKEISRKRINSEGSDRNDISKKYCRSELINDTVDTAQAVVQHVRNFNALTQAEKRQREQINQPYYQHQQVVRSQTTMRADCTQASQQQQHSPEQVAKKHQKCNYNNDITSSLSSSINQNKRKAGATTPPKQNASLNTSTSYSPKAKVQRQQTELKFEQLSKTLSCTTPITPIPATPAERCTSGADMGGQPHRTVSEPVYPTTKINMPTPAPAELQVTNRPKLTLFNKQYDESKQSRKDVDGAEDVGGDYAGVQFVTPKKISSISSGKNAFMERTQKSKLALMLCGLKGEIYQGDVDEIDATKQQESKRNEVNIGIAPVTFSSDVASLSTQTTTTAATTTITSISESKALKPKEHTEVASAGTLAAPSTNVENTSTPPTAKPVTPTTCSATLTSFTSPPDSTVPAPTMNFSFGAPTLAPIGSPTNNPNANKVKSPLVGLKLTPQTTAAPTFNTSTTLGAATAPNPLATTSIPTFSFGAVSTGASTTTISTAPVPAVGPSITAVSSAGTVATNPGNLGGAAPKGFEVPKLQGFTFGAATVDASSKANPSSFSFGQNANKTDQQSTFAGLTSSATQANQTSASAAPSSFAFNASSAKSNTPMVAVTSTNPTGPGTFAFGTNTNQTAATIAPETKPFTFGSLPPATTKASVPAFGGAATSNVFSASASNSSNNFLAQGSHKGFAFGVSAAAVTTTTAATTNSGGIFAAPTMTSTAPAAGMFSTSATNNPASASSTNGIFSFGGLNNQKPAPPAGSFSFGSNNAAPTTAPAATTTTVTQANSGFAFGQAGSTTTTSAFTFGAVSGTATTTVSAGTSKPFGFSSGASSVAPSNNTVPLFGNSVANSTSNTANSTSAAFSFNAAAATNQSSTPLFGISSSNAAKPAANATPSFAFGGKSDSTGTGTAAFSFGTSTVNTTAAAAPQTQSNTAVVKPSFSFGGPYGPTTTENFFGASTSNSTTNANSFASLANSQNRPFSFGGNTNNAAATSAGPTNLFSNAALSSNSNQPNQPTFAFGASNQTAAAGAATSGFSFGTSANNAAPATNTNSPFAFGGSTLSSAQPGAATTAPQPFAFGTASAAGSKSTAPSSGGNSCAMSISGAPASPSPSFSFGSNATVTPSPSPNIFAPPANMAAPSDRPIRRATRRLQKP